MAGSTKGEIIIRKVNGGLDRLQKLDINKEMGIGFKLYNKTDSKEFIESYLEKKDFWDYLNRVRQQGLSISLKEIVEYHKPHSKFKYLTIVCS